jgi:hypothetical protein
MSLIPDSEPKKLIKPEWLSKLTDEEIEQIQAKGLTDSQLHKLIEIPQTTLSDIRNHQDESRRKNPSEKSRGGNKEKLLFWYVKEKNEESFWFIKEDLLDKISDL